MERCYSADARLDGDGDGCDALGGACAPPPAPPPAGASASVGAGLVAASAPPVVGYEPVPVRALYSTPAHSYQVLAGHVRSHMPGHMPGQPQGHIHSQSLHQFGAAASPASSASPGSVRRVGRRFWQPSEDIVLLDTVLAHRYEVPISPNVRHFWDSVSRQLFQEHALQRNTRQCRDRFNLLYARGVRNAACNVEPENARDALILKVARVFHATDQGHYRMSPGADASTDMSMGPSAGILTAPAGATPQAGNSMDWNYMANSVSSLVASTRSLAAEVRDLSARFTQLSQQVRYIQVRLARAPERPATGQFGAPDLPYDSQFHNPPAYPPPGGRE